MSKEAKAVVERFMDPVTVVLNLWASQALHQESGGSGYVHWSEVFPGVPLDEQGQVKTDPDDYRPGPMPENARQLHSSDRTYEASAGKYASAPRFDLSTFSACEVVSWALDTFSGDRDYVRSLLTKIHPSTGRFSLPNEKGDPFVAAARRFLDSGASDRDAKDYARVMRSCYGAFRKLVWVAIGSKTNQDLLAKAYEESRYNAHRRQINAKEGAELMSAIETFEPKEAS